MNEHSYTDEDGILWIITYDPSEKCGPILCKDNEHQWEQTLERGWFGDSGDEYHVDYLIWECKGCTASKEPYDWVEYMESITTYNESIREQDEVSA